MLNIKFFPFNLSRKNLIVDIGMDKPFKNVNIFINSL